MVSVVERTPLSPAIRPDRWSVEIATNVVGGSGDHEGSGSAASRSSWSGR